MLELFVFKFNFLLICARHAAVTSKITPPLLLSPYLVFMRDIRIHLEL
jgi:hypothetical protein